MIRYMVTCLDDDFKTRVLASKSSVFNSIIEGSKYCSSVAPQRVARLVPVVDAETAAESTYFQMVEKTPDVILDCHKAMASLRRERSFNGEFEIVFLDGCDDYCVGYRSDDVNYFDSYLLELIVDGGGE